MRTRSDIPAFGLVEVLVVLAIVATTMVAAMQVSLQGLRNIKLNEISDYANTVMLQALEIAKSPADVQVSGASPISNFNGSYRVQTLSGDRAVLWQESAAITPLTPQECGRSSPYYFAVDTSVSTTPPVACLQLLVERKSNLGINIYELTSKVIFKLEGEIIERNAIGYRRNEFQYQSP